MAEIIDVEAGSCVNYVVRRKVSPKDPGKMTQVLSFNSQKNTTRLLIEFQRYPILTIQLQHPCIYFSPSHAISNPCIFE